MLPPLLSAINISISLLAIKANKHISQNVEANSNEAYKIRTSMNVQVTVWGSADKFTLLWLSLHRYGDALGSDGFTAKQKLLYVTRSIRNEAV